MLLSPHDDWALGVLHTKILCGLTMIGPQWWLRRYVERLYENGVWNLNLKEVLTNLCLPVILVLSLNLAVPYVIAMSLAPLCGASLETQNLIYRRIYPSVFAFFCLLTGFLFNFKQFKKLYEHIKNDKYLVGKQLVNYDQPKTSTGTASQDG
ncbi:MARCH6 [Bugula neritina]|uniref:RING-type E3 ubiquitin transferase n=1 Tax=Bugula neritina TaxID=10212 RepID=A0A7J7J1C9_BUGNE|nr:MARCH6 [Bugula neritina]